MDKQTEQRLVKALQKTWDATAADLMDAGVDDTDAQEIGDAVVDLVSIYGAESGEERRELADLLTKASDKEMEELSRLAFGGK